MELHEIVQVLEREDPDLVLKKSFGKPHSYRGYYEQLGFEWIKPTTVKAHIKMLRKQVGKTYCGYKGGGFKMDWHTECNFAVMGSTGEPITITALQGIIYQSRDGSVEALKELLQNRKEYCAKSVWVALKGLGIEDNPFQYLKTGQV